MTMSSSDTNYQLYSDGKDIGLTFTRVTPTSGTITWTIPLASKVYDGILITLKTSKISVTDYPQDSISYNDTQDISLPGDIIGNALVVAALYGDKITNSITVNGLNANAVYFTSGHIVTNTLNYYTPGCKSYIQFITSETHAKRFDRVNSLPTSPTVGQVVFSVASGLLLMWDGLIWYPLTKDVPTSVSELPSTGIKGMLYYNLIDSEVYVYSGSGFFKVHNSDQGNTRSQNTLGIGTDGSSDERENTIFSIKAQLGYPKQCVELTNTMFNICLDKAIKEFRRRADNAYKRRYIAMKLIPLQSIYYLNDPQVGTDKVVEVIKIERLHFGGLRSLDGTGLFAQQILNSLTTRGYFDLTSFHLLGDYNETQNKIFAAEIGFDWDEPSRELRIFKRLASEEFVMLECSIERKEQELLLDRYAENWIRDWFKAECLKTLGLIRSKFGSLPGPNGGITLNGDSLISMAEEMFIELRRQMVDMEVGNGGTFGNWQMTIG